MEPFDSVDRARKKADKKRAWIYVVVMLVMIPTMLFGVVPVLANWLAG